MATIQAINAWEILDSRGQPTVLANVQLDNGVRTVAAVPSGASTGVNEALELRDGDNRRYLGKGVLQALTHIREVIAPALKGQNPLEQGLIDRQLCAHAGNNLDIQEFMIMPVGGPTFAEALRIAAEVFQTLKKVLSSRGLATGVGDEGGFAPDLPSHEAALDLIMEAIQQAGYRPGADLVLALDPAG